MAMEIRYIYGRRDLPELLIRSYFPERTGRESSIIHDWLKQHGEEFDQFAFSVRIGEGVLPNPGHLVEIQDMTGWNSRMRIDVLTWRGAQPGIVEVKQHVHHGTLGQLMTYRQLFLEENPGSLEPTLTAIGRTSTPDTLRVLQAHGVTVLLYAKG